MAEKKAADIQKVRQGKRQKTGWSKTEIKKRAEQERSRYKKLAENEPDALVSGCDMSKILEESTDEEE